MHRRGDGERDSSIRHCGTTCSVAGEGSVWVFWGGGDGWDPSTSANASSRAPDTGGSNKCFACLGLSSGGFSCGILMPGGGRSRYDRAGAC